MIDFYETGFILKRNIQLSGAVCHIVLVSLSIHSFDDVVFGSSHKCGSGKCHYMNFKRLTLDT